MAINSPLNIAAQPGKTRLRKSLKLWQVVDVYKRQQQHARMN